MNPKISVIIPIYNTERFLEKCLDSVLAQTLIDIEIICVDDCSPDRSSEIVKKYIEKDDRLKYIRNEKNIGLGLTRNTGLDIAVGEYIGFVDSDDWIEKEMYEELYRQTDTEKYDLVCCNLVYDFLVENGLRSEIPEIPPVELITNEFLINEAIAPSLRLFSPNAAWNKIYKREFLENLNLRFESERQFLYEDKIFTISCLAANSNICFISGVYYHYNIRYGSLTKSYNKDFVERYFLMEEKLKAILLENNKLYKNGELQQRFKKMLFEITFTFFLNALVYNKSLKGKCTDFWKIVKDKRISSNAKYFNLSDLPLSPSKTKGLVKSLCFLILKYFR